MSLPPQHSSRPPLDTIDDALEWAVVESRWQSGIPDGTGYMAYHAPPSITVDSTTVIPEAVDSIQDGLSQWRPRTGNSLLGLQMYQLPRDSNETCSTRTDSVNCVSFSPLPITSIGNNKYNVTKGYVSVDGINIPAHGDSWTSLRDAPQDRTRYTAIDIDFNDRLFWVLSDGSTLVPSSPPSGFHQSQLTFTLTTAAIHEMGHMLGLQHDPKDLSSIMAKGGGLGLWTRKLEERRGVLYPDGPDQIQFGWYWFCQNWLGTLHEDCEEL